MSEQPTLTRSLSSGRITLYGLDTIMRAGIHALAGTLAAGAGQFAPPGLHVAVVM